MRNLLNFLFQYGYWLLFILLEVISLTLMFRFNNYQGSVGFTSANYVAGHLHDWASEVSSFFKLRTINEQLAQRNTLLEIENAALLKALQQTIPDSSLIAAQQSLHQAGYQLLPAQAISNSVTNPDNYITINRGEADGVTTEMGIVNGNGIVGIVYMTSKHYAIALSLLNSKSSISCKFKDSEYFGYLKWAGGNPSYAYLEDLPLHALFQKGDTIVTSGHSAIFPQGLMVGTVDSIANSKDGLSYLLRVKLSTDFSCLDNLLVISNDHQQELQQLHKQVQ